MARTRNRVGRRERRQAERHEARMSKPFDSRPMGPMLSATLPPECSYDNGWARWRCRPCLERLSNVEWVAIMYFSDGGVKEWGPQNIPSALASVDAGANHNYKTWSFPKVVRMPIRVRTKDGYVKRKRWCVVWETYRVTALGTFLCATCDQETPHYDLRKSDGAFHKVLYAQEEE